jgi:hypothetical protein
MSIVGQALQMTQMHGFVSVSLALGGVAGAGNACQKSSIDRARSLPSLNFTLKMVEQS